MRSALAILVSSLLLSVPVYSHVVHPADDSPEHWKHSEHSEHSEHSKHSKHAEHSKISKHQTQIVRILVDGDSLTWDSNKTADCHDNDDTCPEKEKLRYGFRCKKKFFNQAKVMAAADRACPRISRNDQGGKFPRTYLGSHYAKPGTVVEWPINKNGKVLSWFGSRKYRLLMTLDCTVVGAVVKTRRGKGEERCKLERH